MRKLHQRQPILALIIVLSVFSFLVVVDRLHIFPVARAATFTVTNTNDSGAGSLRQAILDANSTPGADTVAFNIPNTDPGFNGAVFTIRPLSALPAILDAGTTIDGATQTAFTGNTNTGGPEVVLNGSLAGAGAFGLNINASNCVVKDLVINGFSADGVTLFAPTNSSISGNIVQGCYIGTNASGTAAVGNGNSGVSITAAVGAPGNITASNNTIGGTTAAARNVISGNAAAGVLLNNSAIGNFVQGNFIGTNAAGTGAIPNVQSGVEIGPFGNPSTNNTVGGSTAGAGNVISGNTSHGVSINSSANNIIQGNFIGTNAAGTTSLANGGHGVTVTASGNTTILANVISGNGGNGVTIQNTATGTIVQGNFIGTNASSAGALGNGNNGVFINSSAGNAVGGSLVGAGNVIFNNGFSGVSISGPGTINNAILSNTIGNNGGSGISLIGGGNNNQAPPVATSVTSSGGFIVIKGSATGPPNTTGVVQFFANDTCDPSGSGEGQIFLGSLPADFEANGSTNGDPDPLPGNIAAGKFLTATTTDANNNTSAFSICRVVTNPSFNISGRVLDGSGNPISGLSVDLNGAVQTSTNASGNYVFGSLAAGGNYTVRPSNTSYSFTPANQTFTNLSADRLANFVGTQTVVNITGKVTDSSNAPINNVTVHLSRNGTEVLGGTTDGLGNYTINNLPAGATYVVTPTGTFAPSSQTFSNLTVNATANFKAAPSIPSQCNTPSLGATNFAAGSNPYHVAVGDFNGDGRLDLAVANLSSTDVSILLGTGAGTFGAATNFPVGTNPNYVAVGDFNGDGKLDLAVTKNTGSVSILLGTGTGSFGAATPFAAGSSPDSVAVGDFNGDGQLDLAVANLLSDNVSILLGTGSGTFSAPSNFAVGTFSYSVAMGDFNGDGKLDLAVANFSSDNVSILLGTGTGSFSAATNFAAPSPDFVAVGDFNGDGKVDLVVTSVNSSDVTILLGTGTGSFSTSAFPVSTSPSVAVGDFNGDGKVDLAVANAGLSILLGTGTGSFGAPTPFAAGSNPHSVAVSNFNGDGKLDLAVANQGSDNVSVLLNNGATCNTQTSLTISGQVKDAQNNPLPDVTVTLSGTITRVVQTDINGNYSFSNLTPGGNYSVTLQSNYFVFAASRSDFFNLSSNQTPNFVAAPVAAPSPTPPLSDDFTGSARDPNKWNLGTQTLPPGALDPLVTTAQINGQLVITPLTQATGMHYNGYVSANSFDLRNGKATVELVKAAAGGADTIFGIGSDSDNFARFVVHTPGAPSALITTTAREGIEGLLDATTALLVFQVKVGGQLTALSINYDPVQHRFMRFRHVPAINSIVFETSPNDIDYTVQHTVVLQKGVSALTAELTAGTSNPANPGAAVFDNFSLVTSTFQFSATNYTVGEGNGSISITVTRSGSTTDAASVDFATADGTALQRTKYINAAGRLTFATGEMSKTFDVLIEDNAQAEGDETVNLLLMNPVGSGLNSPARALLNIIDNDTTVATGNPLDDAQFFVTQHYFDFLNRTPDPGGLSFWTGTITQCGADPTCVRNKRIDASNAFFYELEYQQTGAYVFRVDRIAFGNHQPFPNPFPDPNFPGEAEKLVSYAAFAADRARVVGGSALNVAQLDLANAFVQRPEFISKYPANLDGPAFVDAMLGTIMNDLGVNLSSQRAALIDLFNQGGRGKVLYRLADDNVQTNPINNRPLIDAEYTRAFVATQYFGYLRRDADIGGFLFWLGQVSSAPPRDVPKQHAMVCSFITSDEYQQRFSLVVTHHNSECPH
jgi:protocatechuate 3,4-dioxygenase beta subunit